MEKRKNHSNPTGAELVTYKYKQSILLRNHVLENPQYVKCVYYIYMLIHSYISYNYVAIDELGHHQSM